MILTWKRFLRRARRRVEAGVATRKSARNSSNRTPPLRRPLQMETLERRLLLTTFFVDDDWSVGVNPGDDPDGAGPATNFGVDAFSTIQAAVDASANGDTILVNAGTYNENVLINGKNIQLLSTGGRDVTTIEGIAGAGRLGAVQVTGNTTGVQIGAINQGFTIIGFDNASPGLEVAAVYFQGSHSNAIVQGNNIVANGDVGLLTEFGATISGFVIDGNIFSGQTFVGPNPAGQGFGQQFTLHNVPRQLVVMGGGTGGGNTSDITFTNNEITGIAGGTNIDGNEQGNTLVTIDSAGAQIEGNTFAGTTTLFGSALRARGTDVTIENNQFDASNMGGNTSYMFLTGPGGQPSTSPTTLQEVVDANTFDQAVTVNPDGSLKVTNGNISARRAGARVVFNADDLNASHNLNIAMTQTSVMLIGLNGTTINGLTTVTFDGVALRNVIGRLGHSVDNVNVTGLANLVNLNLQGGDNSVTFTNFFGAAVTAVNRGTGSIDFNAEDSTFIALNISGGNVGVDTVSLDNVTVINRTTVNLFGGDNQVDVADSTFFKMAMFNSTGNGTVIDIESVENGIGTRFEDMLRVNVAGDTEMNVSAVSGGGDLVTFSKRALILARQPDAQLSTGTNVIFDTAPLLRNVVVTPVV